MFLFFIFVIILANEFCFGFSVWADRPKALRYLYNKGRANMN